MNDCFAFLAQITIFHKITYFLRFFREIFFPLFSFFLFSPYNCFFIILISTPLLTISEIGDWKDFGFGTDGDEKDDNSSENLEDLEDETFEEDESEDNGSQIPGRSIQGRNIWDALNEHFANEFDSVTTTTVEPVTTTTTVEDTIAPTTTEEPEATTAPESTITEPATLTSNSTSPSPDTVVPTTIVDSGTTTVAPMSTTASHTTTANVLTVAPAERAMEEMGPISDKAEVGPISDRNPSTTTEPNTIAPESPTQLPVTTTCKFNSKGVYMKWLGLKCVCCVFDGGPIESTRVFV